MAIANQWQAPALEALTDSIITKAQLTRVVNNPSNLVATEDSKELAVSALKMFSSNVVVPAYSKW